jgi:hypothetical protein
MLIVGAVLFGAGGNRANLYGTIDERQEFANLAGTQPSLPVTRTDTALLYPPFGAGGNRANFYGTMDERQELEEIP